MNLLILHASPKKRGGASRFVSGLFRLFLPGASAKTAALRGRQDFERALVYMADADAVCLSFPLYVDGLPSHVVEFLTLAEEYCQTHSRRLRLYAIANNGFIEGRQNRTALQMLEAWCVRAGAVWGGGIGIGGGAMLRVLGIVYPILIALTLLQMAASLFTQGAMPPDLSCSLVFQAAGWLFFNAGVLFAMARLSRAVRKGRAMPDHYTRVLIPAFLFIPIADLFMILSSLFHGRLLFTLLRRDGQPFDKERK